MKMKTLQQMMGLDIAKEKYAYGLDEQFGFMSQQKIPDRWVRTTCGYCSVGCGMYVGVKDGKAVSVKGDAAHPVNFGKLCPKGLSEHYTLDTPNRARHPLMQSGKGFQKVSWHTAISEMVSRFRAIQFKHGPDTVAVLSTGQLVTEEFYAQGKLIQLGLGTKNYDGNTTLCMASAVSGYKRSFGSDGPPGAYEDLALADCLFLVGANIADNHPILACWLDQNHNPNKTLIVADPRLTKTAMMADIYLPLKPRSDIALVNGMMHILIKEGMIDKAYIEQHTRGFVELAAHLEKFTPEYVSEKTGLSQDLLVKVARTYGQAARAFIGWTMGVNHSTQGTVTVNVLNDLALITGKVGLPGSSPFSITGQCNAMGTREAGFASSLPGYRKFENASHRNELAALWGIDAAKIPAQRGLAYPDILEAVIQGKVKGLWIIATNPSVSYPNQTYLQDAMSRLDFLVVQDGYHPTPTSEHANMILPAAIWGEKEGTYTNSERRVSKVNKVVEPPGEAKSDFDIFMLVAEHLGMREELFPGWKGPKDAFEEWRKISQGRLCDYSGISYELLDSYGGIQWPFAQGAAADEAPKTRRLYADGVFPTEDGKAQLYAVECEDPPEPLTPTFPFLLNTGRTVEHWHTRTKTAMVPILQKLSPEAWLEMNPRDAKKLGLKQGDRVRVVSQRGSVDKLLLRITQIIAPGQVFMPFHFSETNANNLTLNLADPISREPNYKQCSVRVEKYIR